ncbi:MAG TPA: protoglobin domain-containing protein, partial [Flavobacteriales bacterium]|nr:protoglobin domain-containing protein [Flavobacteriales bacterium]
RAEYDQKWLDYQHEIGLRHHRAKKNKTDGAPSTDIVPFRNLFALIFPVTFTLRPFLGKKGHSADAVEKMYAAWFKAVTMTATLWCEPYVRNGEF